MPTEAIELSMPPPPASGGRPGCGDLPHPLGPQPCPDAVHSDRPTPHIPQLPVGPQVGRGEGGDVHGVAQRLVAGGIDEVPEDLLVVLDASALGVAVPQEYELLLLAGPQPADTLPVDLRGKQTVRPVLGFYLP